jgi:hypothetical protein
MMPNQEYLDSIRRKLDAMNKASGIDPTNRQVQPGGVYGEPKMTDPMEWAGQAAIEYLKSKGKNPNLTDINPGPLFS